MGKFSKDIVKLFEEFKKQTGEYQDLDLEKIEFKNKTLNDIADFPTITKWEGNIDISFNEYKKLRENKKNKYAPLISGSVENNQIVGYIEKSKIKENYLSPKDVISWSRINAKHFFIQKERVCRTEDAFVMKVKPLNNLEYVRYALISVMQNSDFAWTNKAGKNKMKEVVVPIPQYVNKKYSSYKIQKAIADFIKFISLKSDDIVNLIEEITQKAKKGKEHLLYKIFENLPNGKITEDVINLFNEFKKEKGYQDLNLEELEFENVRLKCLFKAKSGNSKYTKKYIQEHKGEYPLLTGKLDNESIEVYIDTYDFEGECITYNKDNAGGSKVFYRPQGFKFSMNSHHVALFKKDSFQNDIDDVDYKYSMYALNNLFENKEYGWEYSANWNRINEESIPIPKPYGNYTSYQIQKIIAEFIEFSFENYLKLIQKIKKESDFLEKMLIRKLILNKGKK